MIYICLLKIAKSDERYNMYIWQMYDGAVQLIYDAIKEGIGARSVAWTSRRSSEPQIMGSKPIGSASLNALNQLPNITRLILSVSIPLSW